MNPRLCGIPMVLAVSALAASAAAQGIGDTAARERAKRAKEAAARKAEPARVFTNDDLKEGEEKKASSEAGQDAAPPPPPPPIESRPPSNEGRREQMASDRPFLDAVSAAENQVRALEARIQELGNKLNPMSGSFIYGPTGSNSPNEEAQVRAELTQTEAGLVRAREGVAQAQRALEDFRRGRTPGPPHPR